MIVLGLDPSLRAFGWAVHRTDAVNGNRCVCRGRFQTSARTLYVERYIEQRERLRGLIREIQPDRIGIEYPIFHDLYSEGMYGLFLFCSEALYAEGQDVVFWSPTQIKAHARESLGRPKGWTMMKTDMVEAAIADTGGRGRWDHNEADAYLCARLSGRLWSLIAGEIQEEDLTSVERKLFLEVQTPSRGKQAGREIRRGVLYREDERFFQWSTLRGTRDGPKIQDGTSEGRGSGRSSEP